MDYFGEQLKAAGFNYYGSEPLYSGIWGEKMEADIYIGVVYYQRLRHMVRLLGPVECRCLTSPRCAPQAPSTS